jgi:predicted RNase H-like HicB family nuclease
MNPFKVQVARDEDEGVWFVESSNIPGLHAEAKTYEELLEVIVDAAPDLIEANCNFGTVGLVEGFPLLVEQKALARRVAAV